MVPIPQRVELASRTLFVLAGPILALAVVGVVVGVTAAGEIADSLMARILAEIDPDSLATLPADFLTPASVQRAAFALAAGMGLLGIGQLATAVALRRGSRWAFSTAVVGGLFVSITVGATAIFMLVATRAQPQATTWLVIGALGLGLLAVAYAAVAVLTARGRLELEPAAG